MSNRQFSNSLSDQWAENKWFDITDCKGKTFKGWRLLAEPLRNGKQLCRRCWARHVDPHDEFDLFDEFGFKRPQQSPDRVFYRPAHAIADNRPTSNQCESGAEIPSGYQFCADCAADRERKRKREQARQTRAEQKRMQTAPIVKDVPRSRECGNQRQPGHTYCEKCARRQKEKSHRARQRQYRKKLHSLTG